MCEEKTQTAQDNYITAKVTVYTTSGAKGDNKAGALIKNYAKHNIFFLAIYFINFKVSFS